MGVAHNVFNPETYRQLVKSFPPVVLAHPVKDSAGTVKYSIAPEFEEKQYYQFLKLTPIWQELYDYIKSQSFFAHLFEVLSQQGFNLPLNTYYTRFEFSFLPWDKGIVQPHRDAFPKVLAFVMPMTLASTPEWGGDTEMLVPIETIDLPEGQWAATFDHFETIFSAPFMPNSANFLQRTDESWHGVRCRGPRGQYRKSITLNLMGPEHAKVA